MTRKSDHEFELTAKKAGSCAVPVSDSKGAKVRVKVTVTPAK